MVLAMAIATGKVAIVSAVGVADEGEKFQHASLPTRNAFARTGIAVEGKGSREEKEDRRRHGPIRDRLIGKSVKIFKLSNSLTLYSCRSCVCRNRSQWQMKSWSVPALPTSTKKMPKSSKL